MNDHQIDLKNARVIDKGDLWYEKLSSHGTLPWQLKRITMLGHYPDNILFFQNNFLYSSNSFSCHLITHFYSVIFHTFLPAIFLFIRAIFFIIR